MEYWSVEVKAGETVKIDPEDKYLHLSQACATVTKKGNEDVPLFVKINGNKEDLGTLNGESLRQITYDLVFEKEFELSNSAKNTSVWFRGYKTIMADEGDEMFESDSESEDSDEEAPEPVALDLAAVNGKPKVVEKKATKAEKAKAEAPKKGEASKSKAEAMKVDDDSSEEDSDEEEDDSDSDNEDPLKKVAIDGEDSDDDDEDDSDDDEDEDDSDEEDEDEDVTPKKVEGSKKRAKEQKTPSQDKKAKVVSPAGAKTDGKKGGHVATPHPAKQVAKTPAGNTDKSKKAAASPKSSGSVTCKSCTKVFTSENALQSHTKAKHA